MTFEGFPSPGESGRGATEHAATTAMPVIECRELTLGYGRDKVLEQINLVVRQGDFLPFVGPNGAGKTTLLRAILGLVRPMSGIVITPFTVTPPGYVSQQKGIDSLYPVSVLDIVMMGFYRRMGWHGCRERQACRDAALRLLERFNMVEHQDKTFAQLSGGMRQKTMVIRALADSPSVLIMDEPTTELDHRTQRELLKILHDSAECDGRTVLLAHHGLDLMASLATRVCLVHDGTARIVPLEKAGF